MKLFSFVMVLFLSHSTVAVEFSTPLHSAVSEGNLKKVVELLDLGINVEEPTKNKRKDTPLQYAVEWGHTDIIETLLKYGANPNMLNGIGYAPIHYATTREYPDLKVLKLLMSYGGDANATATNGTTLLLSAIQNENVNAISYLLKKGADPNTKGPHAPLICDAVMTENIEIISLMAKHGANINHARCRLMIFGAKEPEYGSPMHLEKCNSKLLKKLVSQGADATIKSSKGRTVTQLAEAVEDGWDNGKDCSSAIRYLSIVKT
ncbi:ankyrin repeat domain-containing protein [Agaribacter marinus]|uniref:Uncharacterized protein n=1 Tax=Agaribacter marinus TaxID=1431249 RepID=A0AA37WKB7_9ALTE|nr:ankyrin repeat domain-containing protein [Agaribacter marinus]GLR71299.1 hypothetical protein GCM10007852_22070 [Agaribacter marinus]